MNTIQDPANYRAMSEPFSSPEAANEAIGKFFDMIQEARKACKIQDVHFIVKFHVLHDERESVAITSGHIGNTAEGVGMCVWGLKHELETQETMVQEVMNA